MGFRLPFTTEERQLLSSIARERPDATPGQIAKIFGGRTGRKVSVDVGRAAKSGKYDRPSTSNHLSPPEAEQLKMLILETGPDYCWKGAAEAFEALTGRKLDPGGVGVFAHKKMGLPKIIPERRIQPVRKKALEKRAAAVHAAKLANAPYRPGYFPQSYRGPDGGDGGDRARVYATHMTNGRTREVG